MNWQRRKAGKELAVLFGVWTLTVWGAWSWTGASILTAAGFAALIVALCRFVPSQPRDLKSAGVRLDNFGASLVIAAVPAAVLLAICFAAAPAAVYEPEAFSANRTVQTLASGVAQQAFFLGYLLQRWTVVVGNPLIAVFANALSFALFHLPNVSLVIVTALAGLFFGFLFLKGPNVLAVGLAHGVLSLVGWPLLFSSGLLETRRIGPAELAPLAQTIAAEWRPGDRIGAGPHSVAPAMLGQRFELPVEPVGAGYAGEPFNRDRVTAFFQSEERVFGILTEKDFLRYVAPEIRNKVFIMSERFIVRRKFSFERELWREFFNGRGDIPILAVFRERVLLVSNKPAPLINDHERP